MTDPGIEFEAVPFVSSASGRVDVPSSSRRGFVLVGVGVFAVFLVITVISEARKFLVATRFEHARLNDELYSLKVRVADLTQDKVQSDSAKFDPNGCGSACAEGHSYKLGCVYHVTPVDDESQTEKM